MVVAAFEQEGAGNSDEGELAASFTLAEPNFGASVADDGLNPDVAVGVVRGGDEGPEPFSKVSFVPTVLTVFSLTRFDASGEPTISSEPVEPSEFELGADDFGREDFFLVVGDFPRSAASRTPSAF